MNVTVKNHAIVALSVVTYIHLKGGKSPSEVMTHIVKDGEKIKLGQVSANHFTVYRKLEEGKAKLAFIPNQLNAVLCSEGQITDDQAFAQVEVSKLAMVEIEWSLPELRLD